MKFETDESQRRMRDDDYLLACLWLIFVVLIFLFDWLSLPCLRGTSASFWDEEIISFACCCSSLEVIIVSQPARGLKYTCVAVILSDPSWLTLLAIDAAEVVSGSMKACEYSFLIFLIT